MTVDDIIEGRWVTNRRSGQRWEINWIDWDDDEGVMVGNTGRTRRIHIDSLLSNWIVDAI